MARTRINSTKASGFSLIELLVVLGIIIVLIGVVTIGIRSVVESSKRSQTRAVLQSATALLNEYNVEMKGKTGLTRWYWQPVGQSAPVYVDTTKSSPNYAGANLNFFTVPYRASLDPQNAPEPMTTPDSISAWQSQYTNALMQQLGRLPATAKTLSQLSGHVSKTGTLSGPSMPTANVTTLVDGWGNPLLFVPATGLGLPKSVSGNAGHVLANVDKGSTPNDVNTWTATILDTVKSPDGKPFWASAGADGDFRTGDDNLYSFGEP